MCMLPSSGVPRASMRFQASISKVPSLHYSCPWNKCTFVCCHIRMFTFVKFPRHFALFSVSEFALGFVFSSRLLCRCCFRSRVHCRRFSVLVSRFSRSLFSLFRLFSRNAVLHIYCRRSRRWRLSAPNFQVPSPLPFVYASPSPRGWVVDR